MTAGEEEAEEDMARDVGVVVVVVNFRLVLRRAVAAAAAEGRKLKADVDFVRVVKARKDVAAERQISMTRWVSSSGRRILWHSWYPTASNVTPTAAGQKVRARYDIPKKDSVFTT